MLCLARPVWEYRQWVHCLSSWKSRDGSIALPPTTRSVRPVRREKPTVCEESYPVRLGYIRASKNFN